VPRLTIALYDENGSWIHELGYGYSDERRYFLMRYQRPDDPAADFVTNDSELAAYVCLFDSTQANTGRENIVKDAGIRRVWIM
jgi:hypothetical protein